jgi:hypothetical protein
MRNQHIPESTRGRNRPAGQALVEFALVLPIFLLMFFGVLDGGRAVYMDTVVSQAAREAARVAAVEASWIGSTDPACNKLGGPVCPADLKALEADVLAAANRNATPFGPVAATHLYLSCTAPGSAPTGKWTTQSCAANSAKNLVSVRVELQFVAITPIIAALLPPVWLSGAATMVIN